MSSGLDGILDIGAGVRFLGYLPLTGRFDTELGGYILAGTIQLNMSQFRGARLFFEAEFACISASQTGSIFLYDTTSGDVELASATITSQAVNSLSTELTSVPRTGDRTFEVRAGLDPAGSYIAGDGFTVWNARLLIERF